MTQKPLAFDGNDLTVIPAGGLDPTVLPANVVLSGGTVPFTAPQGGVSAGSTTSNLATLGDVQANNANVGSVVWQAPVLGIVATLPGSPTLGDRWILNTTWQINQWSGSAWVATTPAAGWTTWSVAESAYYEYATGSSSWVDASTSIDHEQLKNLAGGTTGQHNHLTNAQAAALGTNIAHSVVAAPTGATGAMTARLLDGSDIQTGQVASAQGGLGIDASAANGYPSAAAGSFSFSATIPWGNLSSVPSSFTPSAHATTHQAGGSDELALDASQIASGALAVARGGTGLDGSALGGSQFIASPTGGGALVARAIVPDDVSGATAANQVLARKPDNSGNFWTTVPAAYPMIVNNGTPVAAEPNINFINATSIVDSPGTHSVIVTLPTGGGGSSSMDPIVAAIVLG